MTKIDRYILLLYIRILAICFASVAGLLIVVEVFTNLDEFVRYAEYSEQGLISVLVEYFTPRVIDTFEGLSGMLALLALLFVVAWLNKTNEFTALLAAGVTKRRVVQPLLLASAVVVVAAVLVRELVIPSYSEALRRRPQDLTGDLPRAVRPVYDPHAMVLIQGRHLFPTKLELIDPSLKVHGGPLLAAVGTSLKAAKATYYPGDANSPQGYRLEGVKSTKGPIVNLYDEQNEPILLNSEKLAWLAQDEYFLFSDVTYDALLGGSASKKYASTLELMAYLRGVTKNKGKPVRVQIHQRFLRPFIDWTVLLLGLPVLLTRPDSHMFWVAGACIGIVAGFTAIALGIAALGSSSTWLSPALSVWAPLLIFFPWGWARTQAAMET